MIQLHISTGWNLVLTLFIVLSYSMRDTSHPCMKIGVLERSDVLLTKRINAYRMLPKGRQKRQYCIICYIRFFIIKVADLLHLSTMGRCFRNSIIRPPHHSICVPNLDSENDLPCPQFVSMPNTWLPSPSAGWWGIETSSHEMNSQFSAPLIVDM